MQRRSMLDDLCTALGWEDIPEGGTKVQFANRQIAKLIKDVVNRYRKGKAYRAVTIDEIEL